MNIYDLSILVVDDSRAMRRIIISHLKTLRFTNVQEADNGEKALELMRGGENVHLIISDWYMPRMKGIELLKAIRSSDEFSDIPFLMVTAEARKENLVEAVQAGVNGYVTKPFTLEVLQDKLAKLLVKLPFRVPQVESALSA